jgi:hypothetical protein
MAACVRSRPKLRTLVKLRRCAGSLNASSLQARSRKKIATSFQGG